MFLSKVFKLKIIITIFILVLIITIQNINYPYNFVSSKKNLDKMMSKYDSIKYSINFNKYFSGNTNSMIRNIELNIITDDSILLREIKEFLNKNFPTLDSNLNIFNQYAEIIYDFEINYDFEFLLQFKILDITEKYTDNYKEVTKLPHENNSKYHIFKEYDNGQSIITFATNLEISDSDMKSIMEIIKGEIIIYGK